MIKIKIFTTEDHITDVFINPEYIISVWEERESSNAQDGVYILMDANLQGRELVYRSAESMHATIGRLA